MTRPRRSELWSKHTAIPVPPSAGSPFGESHGLSLRVSCMRCGRHRLPVEMSADAMFKFQRRCTDRKACATARGGKS